MGAKKAKKKARARGNVPAAPASTHADLVAENARLKQANVALQKSADEARGKQPAAPTGSWDRPHRPHPLHMHDRIRPVHFEQLKHALETGRDMERGLRSTAIEILNRCRRLEADKLTPNESVLLPLLLAAEANGWRPAPHKGHKLREIQPSKRSHR